jgi:hypothetical protein
MVRRRHRMPLSSRIVVQATVALLTVGFLTLLGIVVTTIWLNERARIHFDEYLAGKARGDRFLGGTDGKPRAVEEIKEGGSYKASASASPRRCSPTRWASTTPAGWTENLCRRRWTSCRSRFRHKYTGLRG